MIRTIFFVIVSLAAVQAQNAPTLSGRVTDPSGAGVADAVVHLIARDAQAQRTVRTGGTGEYRFEAVAPGQYLLSARAASLAAVPVEVTVAATPVTLDLALELARVATAIQVTGTATALSGDEQSKALDVVDASQTLERAEYSVAEAVRNVPGVRVRQLGGPGSLARVNMRGLRPFDSSVLIDGFRFRDSASPQGEASAFLGDLMLVNSDRLEVLRGSGSSLYGTNAAGGVLNLVTDAGGGRTHGDISVDGGGLGLMRGVARLGGSTLRDRLRYSGGFGHLNVRDGVDGNDAYRNSTAQGAAQLSLTPTLELTGRVFAADAFAQLNENPFVPFGSVLPPSGIVDAQAGANFAASPDDPDSSRQSRFLSGLVALSQRVSPNLSWRVQYQGLATDRDNRDGPAGLNFPPQWNNSNYFGGRIDTIQGRVDARRGVHRFTAGYEFEREAFDNRSTDEDPGGALDARVKIAQGSHTLFAQDQIRLFTDRLHISVSGRTQGFHLEDPRFIGGAGVYPAASEFDPPRAWTGDVSAAWYMRGSGTKLRGHVGNGYRAPSLYERYGAYFFFGAFSALGDPRLAPERLVSFDGGIDQYLAGSRVRVSATYFYTQLREVVAYDGTITPATDLFGRWGGYANTGGGIARGIELNVEARPASRTTLLASYTRANSDERRNFYPGAGLRSVGISDHVFTATATQRFGRFDATMDVFAASDYLFPMFAGWESRTFSFEGPFKADLSGGYTLPLGETANLRFFGRVENLTNRTYYEDGFRTPGRWAEGGVRVAF